MSTCGRDRQVRPFALYVLSTLVDGSRWLAADSRAQALHGPQTASMFVEYQVLDMLLITPLEMGWTIWQRRRREDHIQAQKVYAT